MFNLHPDSIHGPVDFLPRVFFDPDPDAGGGDGDGAGDDPPPDPTAGRSPNTREGFESLVDNEGGASAAGMLLYRENYQLREQIRTLNERVATLQGQMPGNDQVVLGPNQAQQWSRYQALGAPDDLQQLRQEYDTLRQQLAVRDAADAHGYKVPVLSRLLDDGMALEVRAEETDDGQQQQVAYVLPAGEEEDPTPLPEYAQKHWADFLPALQAQPQGQQRSGTPYPRQRPAGTPPASPDAVSATLNRRYGHVRDTS